jgi:hypothetical protein
MASSVPHAHGVWSGGLCPITCEQDQKLHRLTQQINRQKGQPHTHTHTRTHSPCWCTGPLNAVTSAAKVSRVSVPVGDWSLCESELATARGSCGNVCSSCCRCNVPTWRMRPHALQRCSSDTGLWFLNTGRVDEARAVLRGTRHGARYLFTSSLP